MRMWSLGALQLVASDFLLEEISRLLPKMTARLGWSAKECRDYVELMRFLCDTVEPALVDVVRDKNDNPILGTLIAAQADYLITGDKDLLVLADQYPILSPAQFLQRHG